jgi:predicted permease
VSWSNWRPPDFEQAVMPDATRSLKLYRRLLKLYPASFREGYAGQLEREFRDELGEARSTADLAALWFRLLLDLAISVPAQLAREILQDSRHALRQWARRPLNTAFAIAALAIGIGANTGIFSVVDALLLRPLPFRDADRLVGLYIFQPPHDSARQFHAWRQNSAYMEDAALVEPRDVNVDGAGEASRAHLVQTSWNFFALLGAQPILGRGFEPGEDEPGRNDVTVIGYGLWQQLSGGDPRAVGSAIRVDGTPLTIVGVAPPGFDFPQEAALWRPADFRPLNNGWSTIARLKPGVSLRQARVPFLAEADRWAPNRSKADKLARPSLIMPLQAGLSSNPQAPPHSPPSARTGSLILLAGAMLILLIACTNVANLLLARTADRATELSVRSALGASRARLTQQLLTECILMSLAAAAAGVLVAQWIVSFATKIQPLPIASQTYSILNVRVIGFTLAISILCGLLFGVLPSLYASHVHTFGSRGSTTTRGSRRMRESLVGAQVALTLILLASALSINRASLAFEGMDRGFDRQGVVTVSVSMAGTTQDQGERRLQYIQEALRRVRQLPGVRSASTTEFLPLAPDTGYMGGPFSLDGRPAHENAMHVPVLPGYIQTMGGRMIAGREFTDADLHSDAQVALVSDLFAAEFGNPADAVGHQLRIGNRRWTVAGVFKGMVYLGDYNHAQVLVPDRSPGDFTVTVVARVDGRPEARLAMVRDAIKSVDPQVPVFDVKTLDTRLDEALVRPKFYSTAALFFAGFALLLAVIGIYGVVSYSVAQRSHEMGVRLALGTTPGRLRGSLLRQALTTVACGAVPGILGALAGGKFIEALIDNAKPIGITACISAALLIGATAAAAVWSATRRVARLDIMEVLRTE